MPANPVKDFLLLEDDGAGGVIGLSVVALLISAVSVGLFLFYYNSKIIKMSQRRLVGVFLLGCLMLNLTFFVLLRPISIPDCRLGRWWPNLWFTVAFAPILVKTWFMWAVFNKTRDVQHILGTPVAWTMAWVKSGLFSLTARTFLPVFIEILLLLAATLNGEMDPSEVTTIGTDGVYETRSKCGLQHGTGVFTILDLVFKGLMVLLGCVLAFATRQISSFLAESYSLAIIVYSITIFGLMIYLITAMATLDVEASLLLSMVGVCWSTSVSTIVLLGPRFLKLLTVGDEAAAAWLNNTAISTKHLTPSKTATSRSGQSKHESKNAQSKTAPSDVNATEA
jgi:hypothetical protein